MNGFYGGTTTSDVYGSTFLAFITDTILEILNNPKFKVLHYFMGHLRILSCGSAFLAFTVLVDRRAQYTYSAFYKFL